MRSLFFLVTLLFFCSCNNKLGKSFFLNSREMSRLVKDSTGFEDQTKVIAARLSQKRMYYFMNFYVRQHPFDSLGYVSEKIDRLLHINFPLLNRFYYRYYSFNTYKRGKDNGEEIDKIIYTLFKTKDTIIIDTNPSRRRLFVEYPRIADSIYRSSRHKIK